MPCFGGCWIHPTLSILIRDTRSEVTNSPSRRIAQYTAIVRGAGGNSSGIVVVEVYNIP